jgi:chaperonin GroES
MVIKPMADNIIVRVIQEDTGRTASGIFLPKTNTKSDLAEVVAIGEGRTLNNGTILKSSLSIGDEVIFNKFAGNRYNGCNLERIM